MIIKIINNLKKNFNLIYNKFKEELIIIKDLIKIKDYILH